MVHDNTDIEALVRDYKVLADGTHGKANGSILQGEANGSIRSILLIRWPHQLQHLSQEI